MILLAEELNLIIMKKPGDDQKITNADEQEVAVNASSTDEGGYDEPIDHTSVDATPNPERSKEGKESEKKRTPTEKHYKVN